jgi:hypothetical protein
MSKSITISRKERLEKLRAAKAAKDGGITSSSSSSTSSKKRPRNDDGAQSSSTNRNTNTNTTAEPSKVKFRNYAPGTIGSKIRKLKHSQPPSAVASAIVSEAVAVAGAPRDPTAPIVVVQKKIDWDLKRDIEPQLRIIERRTRIAIRELLKQQLQG